MDFGLSEEQQMIVDTVRDFVATELVPHEDYVEEHAEVPRDVAQEIVRKTRELGFFAANMPEEVGGGGLSHMDMKLIERELGHTSMALSTYFGRPSNVLMACEGEQREEYLFPCVRGEKFNGIAITEPNAGSDVRQIATVGRKDGDDWIVNGTKHFISHAEADFFVTFVATGEEETPRGIRKKITCFLVDRDAAGLSIQKGYNCISHRGFNNIIMNFDDCRLPSSKILGEIDRGFEVVNKWLFAQRLTVAVMCVGRARRAFNLALNYAAEREQFGKPIGMFQGIGFKLADMITEIDAADWLALSVAWKMDQGIDVSREIASAKVFATEMCQRVTDEAIQVFGGMGLMDELPLERFWRDARVERIWDGTSEIQRHIISRELMRSVSN